MRKVIGVTATVSGFIVCCLFVWMFSGREAAQAAGEEPKVTSQSPIATVTHYDNDPNHLWNQLHAALFIRRAKDGPLFGVDDLDPVIWDPSVTLLAGEHNARVLTLLDEFIQKKGENLIHDPLKRAVLQHDLWSIFDWSAGSEYGSDAQAEYAAQRVALQTRLAKVIRAVALSSDQIRKLPDTYSAAIATQNFPATPDSKKPETAFLPPDLFDPHGPWVLLGEHMQSAAPVHLRFVKGRSAFFVLMKLPGGRRAAIDYLERLSKFSPPILSHSASEPRRINPELPQFPADTQVALARTMLLIDDYGKLTSTRILEAVQFRTFREVPEIKDRERPATSSGKQDFHEFRFRRQLLFSGATGGMYALNPKDAEFRVFVAHQHDILEDPNVDYSKHDEPILRTCSGCHGGADRSNSFGPGILSVQAFTRGLDPHHPPAPLLQAFDREQQEEAAIHWKRNHYTWGLMQGLSLREK